MSLAQRAAEFRTAAVGGWLRDTRPGRTVARVVHGLVEIQLVDRALALAAQMFTSVLPVIIAASVFSGWHTGAETISDQFGFSTGTLAAPDADTSDPSFAAFGVVGLLMVVLSGTSFARALGRVYGAVWQVPSMGPRDAWRWLAALLAVALSVGLVGQTRDLSHVHYVGFPLAVIGELVVWTLVWTFAAFLLTKGALTGRLLWVTGALTAIGLTAVHAAGRVALPRITANAQQHFGSLGLAFTSVSWLFVMSIVIVGSAAIVRAFADDETFIDRFLRGPDGGADVSDRL
ncbi:hypothetical protein [Nocardia sp. NPDC056000]|uniref:hypothetical protein n=1 Tax=Nocardia sp. NPDC056000 TaxID=3345674 RepID=UPI0035E13892